MNAAAATASFGGFLRAVGEFVRVMINPPPHPEVDDVRRAADSVVRESENAFGKLVTEMRGEPQRKRLSGRAKRR
jgi:hypothetical protein